MTQEMVKVKVLRAVAWDGIRVSPDRSGKKVTPVEALVPRSVALAHGPGDLEILGEPVALAPPPPAPEKQALPARQILIDKQARPTNDK